MSKMYSSLLISALAILSLIFIIGVSDYSSSAVDDEFTVGDLNYKVTEEGETNYVSVTGFSGSTVADLVIPSTVSYNSTIYNVNAIGTSAFATKGIKTVNLGNVTEIGTAAFSGCVQLTSVTGNSVTEVGSSSFSGCVLLTSFTGSGVTKIGMTAFSGCVLLSNIDLSKATSIGMAAFLECKALKVVYIAKAITVGGRAFYGSGLTAILIPKSTINIGGSAFNKCSSLASISISPLNLRYEVDNGALVDKITNTFISMPEAQAIPGGTYTVSDGIKKIDDGAFDGCDKLQSVIIPSSVKEIGDGVFNNCPNLSTVTVSSDSENFRSINNCLYSYNGTSLYFVPESATGVFALPSTVTKIVPYAFSDCAGITSVDLSNVTDIGKYAFSDCYGMTLMYIKKDTSIGVMALDLGSIQHPVTCTVRSDGADFIGTEEKNLYTTINYYVSVVFELRNAPSQFSAPEKIYIAQNGTLDLTSYKAVYTGYNFDTYVDDVLCTENTITVADSERTVSFRFNGTDRYTITFDTNGGSYIAPITLESGASVPTIDPPTKNGYTFTSWTPALPSVMPAQDITVTANWIENTYTVTFDKNEGDSVSPATVSVTYGQDYGTLATASRTGYTFDGWFTSSTGGDEVTSDSEVTITADQTLYAHWTVNMYMLTIHYVGYSSAIDDYTENLAYGSQYSIQSPAKEGYTADKLTVEGTIPADNVEITVTYTIDSYTVHITGEGLIVRNGTVPVSDGASLIYGSELTISITYKIGNTGKMTANGTEIEGGNFTVKCEVTFNGSYEPNTYTITFDSDGGSTVESITAKYGSPITAPTDPVKEGYTFSGWYPALPSTMPADGLNVKAGWTINQYTISFNSNGGSAVSPITQDYASAVSAPANPTKAKYEFVKWQLEGKDYTFTTMPAKNITLDAVWLSAISSEDVVTEGDTKKVSTNETTTKLNKGAIDSLKNGSNNVQISTKDISLDMSTDSFGKLAGSNDMTISAEKSTGVKNTKTLEKLSDAKKKIAAAATVLDISVKTNGMTSDLGTVRMTAAYTLAEGQSANKIAAYYIADSGEFTKLNSTYADGKITVESSHFSTFAVCSEELTESSNSSGGMNVGLIIGIVVGAIVIIGLIIFFVKKH